MFILVEKMLSKIWRKNDKYEVCPCNPSPDYKFTKCVRESLVKRVNCSLPWAESMSGKCQFQVNFLRALNNLRFWFLLKDGAI